MAREWNTEFFFYGRRGRAILSAFMGRVYLFTCPRCEYRAKVSGGADDGFHCATQTILCRDCNALHDAIVRMRATEPKAPLRSKPRPVKSLVPKNKPAILPEAVAPDAWLFGGQAKSEWKSQKLRCPVAPHHRIQVWVAPGKCPRCGTWLERAMLPWRVWD